MTDKEERELRTALQAALHLLGELEAEARDTQVLIQRFRRRHAAALGNVGVAL